MGAEDGGEHAELHPAQIEFGIVAVFLLMAAEVVSPIAETHIRCCSCKIRLPGQSGEVGERVAREADGIAMAAQSAPAVEDEGPAVGAVQSHVVVEDMIAPESLAQSFDILTREILLPVDPPEVDTLCLACAQDSIKHSMIETLVAQVPRYHLCRGIHTHIVAHLGKEVFIVVDTVGGMEVEGHAQSVVVHKLDESLWIGNGCAVPCPAGPALCVPVHVEDHHVHRNLVALHVVDNLHKLVGSVALILAVPIAQHEERRHRLTTSHTDEVAQGFLILMTIAEEIPVDGILVGRFGHPFDTVGIAFEGEGRATIAALGTWRFVDDTPSCAREDAVLQFGALVVTLLTVERTCRALQVQSVILARMPRNVVAVQGEVDTQYFVVGLMAYLATQLVAQLQRTGRDIEVAAPLFGLEFRHGQPPVDDGKGGTVFKLFLLAIFDANHLGCENGEASIAFLHDGSTVGYGVELFCSPTSGDECQPG